MDEGRSLTLQQHFNTACLLCLLTGLVLWMRTAVLHEKEETLHRFSLEKEKPSSLCSQTRRFVNTPFSFTPPSDYWAAEQVLPGTDLRPLIGLPHHLS